ncbi:hypothetical protein HDV00_005272 [Rhizophlyctis rosea]|nr:hypothetical protein HDV00_005272 [Rhizophlyctis rosea]
MTSPPSPRTITIVGATGNTGAPLLRLLAPYSSRFTIRACTRDPKKANAQFAGQLPNVTFVQVDGDAKDEALLDAALEGAVEVIMLKPFFWEDYGLGYTQRWMDAIKRNGKIRKVHLLSGLGGLRGLRGEGKFTKMVQESESPVVDSEIDYTILRPTWFHSNSIFFWAQEIKRHDRISMPWEYGRFNAISPEDVAACFLQLLKDGPERHSKAIYNITTRELLDGPTITAAFSRALGRPIRYEVITGEEHIKRQMAMGVPKEGAEESAKMANFVRTGDFNFTLCDLKTLTGRDGVTFEQWVFENADSFR